MMKSPNGDARVLATLEDEELLREVLKPPNEPKTDSMLMISVYSNDMKLSQDFLSETITKSVRNPRVIDR
jgi:hypothetical protein